VDPGAAVSHAFDSGLALPVRSLIRVAVAGLLAPKLASAGGYLAALIPFPRVIADRHDEDGIEHSLTAPVDGVVELLVAVGDQVKVGQPLARITATKNEEGEQR